LLLQHTASVVKYQQIDNITVLFYAVNVSTVITYCLTMHLTN